MTDQPVAVGHISVEHAAETEDGKPKVVQYGAVRWADGTVTWGSMTGVPGSPAAQAFVPDKQYVSGLCAARSHLACPGMIAQPRAGGKVQVALCGCACAHGLASIRSDRVVVGGFRCTKCSARRPLLQQPFGDGPLDLHAIDPRTGACVDRDLCGQLVAHKLNSSPHRRNAMPRAAKIDDDGNPVEKPARTPRVKEGKCEHCGTKTNGGKFAPGHDAQLKSALIRTYADRDAPADQRVDALAEANARGWLKNRSAFDVRPLMKGVKEDEAKKEIASDFDALLEQADKRLADETAEELLKRRTAERVS